MLGAIIGDIAGSVYEGDPIKTKDFELFDRCGRLTDDSIMTIAVGCACVEAEITDEQDFKRVLVFRMRELGNMYPHAGYGGRFYYWLINEDAKAYNSFGNGSAMRVSPVGWAAETLEQAETLAKWSAEVTHNHEEGVKGAQAVAAAIFLSRQGADKKQIRDYITDKYYDLDFRINGIRRNYSFDVTSQGSVPQAIECFLESVSYEDAVRNAVSLGGDSDTQGAIAGSIAEAFYGVPDELAEEAFSYFDETLLEYYNEYAEQLYT